MRASREARRPGWGTWIYAAGLAEVSRWALSWNRSSLEGKGRCVESGVRRGLAHRPGSRKSDPIPPRFHPSTLSRVESGAIGPFVSASGFRQGPFPPPIRRPIGPGMHALFVFRRFGLSWLGPWLAPARFPARTAGERAFRRRPRLPWPIWPSLSRVRTWGALRGFRLWGAQPLPRLKQIDVGFRHLGKLRFTGRFRIRHF